MWNLWEAGLCGKCLGCWWHGLDWELRCWPFLPSLLVAGRDCELLPQCAIYYRSQENRDGTAKTMKTSFYFDYLKCFVMVTQSWLTQLLRVTAVHQQLLEVKKGRGMSKLETGNWVQIQIPFLCPKLNLFQFSETHFPTNRWRIRLFVSFSETVTTWTFPFGRMGLSYLW